MELTRFLLTTQTTANHDPRLDTSLDRLMQMKAKAKMIFTTRIGHSLDDSSDVGRRGTRFE